MLFPFGHRADHRRKAHARQAGRHGFGVGLHHGIGDDSSRARAQTTVHQQPPRVLQDAVAQAEIVLAFGGSHRDAHQARRLGLGRRCCQDQVGHFRGRAPIGGDLVGNGAVGGAPLAQEGAHPLAPLVFCAGQEWAVFRSRQPAQNLLLTGRQADEDPVFAQRSPDSEGSPAPRRPC